MLSYNILNDFVEKLKSGNVKPDDLIKVSNAVKDSDLQVKYEVENIKAIPSDILNEVKCGDVIAKKTGEQYHCYIVTYKQENHGICLTYFDASVVETQSYDYVTNAWVYNSEDKTGIIYTAGTGINITNGQINADTTVLQEKLTAGTNITIADGVISAAAGDVWQSRLRINTGNGSVEVEFYTKEEITDNNKLSILTQELGNGKFKELYISQYGLPVINSEISMPITLIQQSGNTLMHYYELSDPATIKSVAVTLNASAITVEWSHKIV